MPFDGHLGQWEPRKQKPDTILPNWLPYALVTFVAVMGAVLGLQAAIAVGLFCSMVLSWPHALMTMPGPLFLPFASLGACLGGCITLWVIRSKRHAERNG